MNPFDEHGNFGLWWVTDWETGEVYHGAGRCPPEISSRAFSPKLTQQWAKDWFGYCKDKIMLPRVIMETNTDEKEKACLELTMSICRTMFHRMTWWQKIWQGGFWRRTHDECAAKLRALQKTGAATVNPRMTPEHLKTGRGFWQAALQWALGLEGYEPGDREREMEHEMNTGSEFDELFGVDEEKEADGKAR